MVNQKFKIPGIVYPIFFIHLLVIAAGICTWQSVKHLWEHNYSCTVVASGKSSVWTAACGSDQYEYQKKNDIRTLSVYSKESYKECGSLSEQGTVTEQSVLPIYMGTCNGNVFVGSDVKNEAVLYMISPSGKYNLSCKLQGQEFSVTVNDGKIVQ